MWLFLDKYLTNLSVKIRYRPLKHGAKRPYIQICSNGRTTTRKIDIIIHKNDPFLSSKKQSIEQIRLETEVKLSQQPDYKPVKKSDLATLFVEFISENTGKLASIRKYKSTLIHVIDFFPPHKTINSLTKNECQEFADYLYDLFSIAGANTYLKSFKRILNLSVERGLISQNVASNIKLEKEARGMTKEILLIDEILRLWSGDLNVYKRAFIFACYTGVGLAECKKITPKNFSNNLFSYHRSKNNRFVTVDINEEVKSLAFDNFEALPSDSFINRKIKSWVIENGINKKITFYCARHSFCVNLLLSDVELTQVSELMGHDDINRTMQYLKYARSLRGDGATRLRTK